jgi:pyruvyltransferase
VRGPLTRETVLRQGIACPPVYGDPALLYPRFYRPPRAERHALGLVPHRHDVGHPLVRRLAERPGVLLIDPRAKPHDVLDRICQCAAIASSSLHGLVMAAAYGIPSLWIEVSDRVEGGGFKFRDFYGSVGSPIVEPFRPRAHTTAAELAERAAPLPIDLDLDALLDACPFRPAAR